MANEARIGDEDDCESADYYICMRADSPAYFDDDKFDFCCKCGEKVRFRPYGPVAPAKICFECAMSGMGKQLKKNDLTLVTSQQAAEEFKEKTGSKLFLERAIELIKRKITPE